MRKNGKGDGKPPEKGDYNVLNIDTNEIVATDRTQHDAELIAGAYNHRYCKPVLPNKYFAKNKNH